MKHTPGSIMINAGMWALVFFAFITPGHIVQPMSAGVVLAGMLYNVLAFPQYREQLTRRFKRR